MDFEIVKNIIKKHEKFLEVNENYSKNLNIIYDKLEVFYYTINQLKENCLKTDLDNHFEKFNIIFKDFGEEINKFIEPLDNSFLKLIKNIQRTIKNKDKENIDIFNSIKSLLKQEEELNKKQLECEKSLNKNGFFNFFWSNKPGPDEKLFNESSNESKKQIYQYEIDSIRDQIKEKYIIYNNIYNEVNDIINNSSEIILPLSSFSEYINNFSNALKTLYSKIINQINNMNKRNEINNNKKNNNANIIIKSYKDDCIVYDERKKDAQNNITNIIQKIIRNENKLQIQEIVNINNILEINVNSKNKNKSKEIFLSQLSDMCLNGIIIVQNEYNFNYLTNILNAIFLQEKTNDILSKIILISSHVKYKDNYLYEILRKNNKYLRTKMLWTKLIEKDLIEKIKNNIDNLISDKGEEGENKIKEKIDISSIMRNLGIEKEISYDFKKLNYSQIKKLKGNIQEYTRELISEYIPLFHQFLVKDEIFNEIIKFYSDKLNLSDNLVNYLQNLFLCYNLNSKYRKKYYTERDKTSLIISEVLKFLPKQDFIKFISLNKNLKPKLKKHIFTNIFKYKDLNIDLHIKYLGEYLQIFEIKKKHNYNNLKQELISYLKINDIDPNINKKNELIKNDLKRTIFIQNNPTHNESIESILFTFNYSFQEIGYYQGFNVIVTFLYQLLNYDEEKTFYYFYGLHFNAKYNLVFRNKFAFLNILFSVFEKIIKLNIPEILYIIKNIKVDLDYFCSSWFTTLFIGNINTFNKDSPPFLLIYFIEKFCINGWSAIFNLGLTVLKIGYEKIIRLEKEELIRYIMKIVAEENIFDNKNYEKCKEIYEKYEKVINEEFVEKIIEITKFENENNYLINN